MNAGAGVFLHGDHAYVSSGGRFRVVNVSDPSDPRIVGHVDEPSRDGDMIFFENGAQIAVLASGAMDFADVTDPEEAVPVGYVFTGKDVVGMEVLGFLGE